MTRAGRIRIFGSVGDGLNSGSLGRRKYQLNHATNSQIKATIVSVNIVSRPNDVPRLAGDSCSMKVSDPTCSQDHETNLTLKTNS
jgi:hypothetical protein